MNHDTKKNSAESDLASSIHYSALEEELTNRWLERIKRGYLRFIVLHIFNERNKDRTLQALTGNDVKEIIARNTFDHWRPSPGSLYPILAELERDRLILLIEGENKRNKMHKITARGEELYQLLRSASILFGHTLDSTQPMTEDKTLAKQRFFSLNKNKSLQELHDTQKNLLDLVELTNELIQQKVSKS